MSCRPNRPGIKGLARYHKRSLRAAVADVKARATAASVQTTPMPAVAFWDSVLVVVRFYAVEP